jgi:hypothetical protein
MKKTLSILYFLCTSFLVCTIVDAAPVVASISGTQTAHVGERVIITISYTANSSSPVFTASGDVKYDTTALDETGVSFGSSWLPVGKPPYEVTEPGHILRTAGYPAGLSSTDRFITISFTAKKPGVTNINLTGGMALGQEDSDYGVSPRSFSINIIGDDPVFENVVGRSLSQTFTRSINTSMTIIIVLLALYFFGPVSTKTFALVLTVGLFFGTYSSIFLASPLLTVVANWQNRKSLDKKNK